MTEKGTKKLQTKAKFTTPVNISETNVNTAIKVS